MKNNEISARLESIESRITHQEAAIEELTRTLLQQEQLISSQLSAIERLETMIRSLSATHSAPPGDEAPPHY
jgi:SlyX protein